MALNGPDTEDRRKIHLEVNQLVNQRLLITSLAVTVFAAITAWLIPKSSPAPGSDLGAFVYIASILLVVALFALFFLMHIFTRMLRIFTTYLIVTDASGWEKDWVTYRSKFPYLGYTKPLAGMFILLGIAATLFPLLLRLAYPVTLRPIGGLIFCVIVGLFYVAGVYYFGRKEGGSWRALWEHEDELRQRWETLKKDK